MKNPPIEFNTLCNVLEEMYKKPLQFNLEYILSQWRRHLELDLGTELKLRVYWANRTKNDAPRP
jgi:hypothetical protein